MTFYSILGSNSSLQNNFIDCPGMELASALIKGQWSTPGLIAHIRVTWFYSKDGPMWSFQKDSGAGLGKCSAPSTSIVMLGGWIFQTAQHPTCSHTVTAPQKSLVSSPWLFLFVPPAAPTELIFLKFCPMVTKKAQAPANMQHNRVPVQH